MQNKKLKGLMGVYMNCKMYSCSVTWGNNLLWFSFVVKQVCTKTNHVVSCPNMNIK